MEYDELPVPEEDEELVDLKYIHWGYLNCCQTIHKGRKAKNEVWNTYWVTLCGTTLRFYVDAALHSDSVFYPPPPSSFGPLPENQHKVAFFELDGGKIDMLDDGKVFRRKMKKSIYSKVFRQHLFRVKLPKINSYYAFQAPSKSSLFTWLSKIQESIDAIENHQISFLAEERLQLAQFMMEQKLRKDMETKRLSTQNSEDLESYEIFDMEDVKEVEKEEDLHPKLKNLKDRLREKRELLWQIETQIIDFLGNKGSFKRTEFTCCTTQDYYLVPGRMGTFVPAGTNVTIFGQLPNKRWRCLVEMDELINTMNGLLEDLGSTPTVEGKSSDITSKHKHSRSEILQENPLVGSLPTSILKLNGQDILRASETPLPDDELMTEFLPEESDDVTLSPYSGHYREKRKTPVKPILGGSLEDKQETFGIDTRMDSLVLNENSGRQRDASTITQDSNFEDFPDGVEDTVDSDDDENRESDVESVYNNTKLSFLRGEKGSGFLISKKLRQKGISIMVGSSSSEDEDDAADEDRNNNDIGYTNAVYRKFGPQNKENTSAENISQKNTKKHKDLKQSKSLGNMNGEFSTHTDLLRTYGQQSIQLTHDKELTKTVMELFNKKKGPDVKPPRNERRTLKLQKTDNGGFGFWLQTFDFAKNGSENVQNRTFVRYVEDEGPAYMGGLREGDVIVEINNQHVEVMDHAKVVQIIKEEKCELILVVKFIDAVRRVELAVRLKKRQAKLKSKEEELERLKREENNLLNGRPLKIDDTLSESSSSLTEAEEISLYTSTESEISSISSVSDEIIVRTSKFGKRSSHVLDSIKELNCNESVSTFNMSDLNRVSTTTEDELLNFYGDSHDYTTSLPRGVSAKRYNTMSPQKYRSLPRKRMIDLDGCHAREFAIDHSSGHLPTDSYTSNDSFDYGPSDDSSDDYSSRNSVGDRSFDQDRVSRRHRPKSYKLAMHPSKRAETEIHQV